VGKCFTIRIILMFSVVVLAGMKSHGSLHIKNIVKRQQCFRSNFVPFGWLCPFLSAQAGLRLSWFPDPEAREASTPEDRKFVNETFGSPDNRKWMTGDGFTGPDHPENPTEPDKRISVQGCFDQVKIKNKVWKNNITTLVGYRPNSKNNLGGFVSFYVQMPEKGAPLTGKILLLATADNCKRRGWGEFLLNRAIEDLKKKGVTRITLDIWPHNTEAFKFYKRQGFIEESSSVLTLAIPY